MVAIAICLVANAYAFCSIFPYAGYMVLYLGVTDDKDKTGKFACGKLDRVFHEKRMCLLLIIIVVFILTKRF